MSLITSITNDIKREFENGNVLVQLIAVNIAAFVLYNVLNLALALSYEDRASADVMFRTIMEWIMLPTDPLKALTRPWTILTHMFSHIDFRHIFWNMVIFYIFGKVVRDFIGNKTILPIYILGGLVGAIVMIISLNIFPGLKAGLPALGASAGVMAIVLAAATLVPDFTFFIILIGPVKIKYIAAIVFVLDIIGASGGNAGGSIAHIGGAITGYLYISQLRQGNDWSKLVYGPLNWFKNLISFNKKGPKVYYTNKEKNPTASRKKQGRSKNKQERIDEILDKISQTGYDGLSAEEKEFLFKASKDKGDS